MDWIGGLMKVKAVGTCQSVTWSVDLCLSTVPMSPRKREGHAGGEELRRRRQRHVMVMETGSGDVCRVDMVL